MIKFFRKIRQNLISEGKTVNYLKYAIGEIILVVIGILIALQVNNWNEEKKNAKNLRTALRALQTEIQENKSYLDSEIKNIESDLNDLEYYINLINTPEPKTLGDTVVGNLIKRIGLFTFLPLRENAYTNLIGSGLINQVKNDSLKLLIIDIERGYQLYEKYQNRVNTLWENKLKPYYLEHSDILTIRDTLYKKKAPNRYFTADLSAFINNREFINILTIRLFGEENAQKTFGRINNRLESINNQIENYLNSN